MISNIVTLFSANSKDHVYPANIHIKLVILPLPKQHNSVDQVSRPPMCPCPVARCVCRLAEGRCCCPVASWTPPASHGHTQLPGALLSTPSPRTEFVSNVSSLSSFLDTLAAYCCWIEKPGLPVGLFLHLDRVVSLSSFCHSLC